MKKFLYVLLCLLLIAGIGGSAVLLAKNINSDTQIEQPDDSLGDVTPDDSNTGGNVDSGNTDGGNTESGVTEPEDNLPTLKGLKIPENEADYIDTRMEMVKGAQLSLTEGDRALRFTCNFSTELYEEVQADENK